MLHIDKFQTIGIVFRNYAYLNTNTNNNIYLKMTIFILVYKDITYF